MKRLTIAMGLICLLAIVAFVHGPELAQSSTAGQALKSHHLFNLPEGITEEQAAKAFQEMNRIISESGHPNAGYRFWKVSGEQSGEYSYLVEGVWSDQATYDAIHESESFKKVMGIWTGSMFSKIENEIYNRFVEIPTGGPQT